MLPSFEITNFRTFSHLRIERLGRVNLITGRNNVGKTTLLEALRLYGSIWPRSTITSLLFERNEVVRSAGGKRFLLLHSLFHGRDPREGDAIQMRQLGSTEREAGFRAIARLEAENRPDISAAVSAFEGPGVRLALDVCWPGRHFTVYADGSAAYTIGSESPKVPEFAPDPPYLRGVGTQEGFEDLVANWWDAFSLTDAERDVVEALQFIAPIRRVSFVGNPRSEGGRIAKTRVDGVHEPVALATLGDGVVRMFQIAVALEYAAIYGRRVSEAGGGLENVFPVLLVDEVESGIHYTVHADLWRFVLRAARLLGVQVFATTHSWDCIEGFQKALADDKDANGLLIRLERKEDIDKARAVVIDPEDLPIVTRESIEVR